MAKLTAELKIRCSEEMLTHLHVMAWNNRCRPSTFVRNQLNRLVQEYLFELKDETLLKRVSSHSGDVVSMHTFRRLRESTQCHLDILQHTYNLRDNDILALLGRVYFSVFVNTRPEDKYIQSHSGEHMTINLRHLTEAQRDDLFHLLNNN